MPPLPPAVGVFRASIEWQVGSDLNVNSHSFWTYTGPIMDNSDAASWAADILGYAAAQFVDLLHTANSIEAVTVQDLSSSMGGVGTTAGSHAGTAGGDNLPAGTAVLVNFPISRHYRGGKPKVYLPLGNATNLQTPSEWTATFKTDVDAAWAAFAASVIGTSGEPQSATGQVNVSYYSGYGPARTRSNGHSFYPAALRAVPHLDPIAAGVCSLKPSSQRRRYQR